MSKLTEDVYSREPPKAKSFMEFLYDPVEGTVMGRNGQSWAKILTFYLIFYACLAALSSLCFWLFLLTIDSNGPKWYLDDSLIGSSPGLGFRPMSHEYEESTLIWYNVNTRNNYKNWTKGLDEFLQEYQATVNKSNVVPCNYTKSHGRGEVCKVDVNKWYPCIASNKYGYADGHPCVFIKLNKILKWEPDYYDDPDELPRNMPKDLIKYIEAKAKSDPKSLKTVWVSCEGENPADKENIGVVEYIPYRGFPGFYYPFEKSNNYLSPLVALHFKNIKRNVLVNVECRAWAGNILHDRRDRVGMVHFELMVDD